MITETQIVIVAFAGFGLACIMCAWLVVQELLERLPDAGTGRRSGRHAEPSTQDDDTVQIPPVPRTAEIPSAFPGARPYLRQVMVPIVPPPDPPRPVRVGGRHESGASCTWCFDGAVVLAATGVCPRCGMGRS